MRDACYEVNSELETPELETPKNETNTDNN